jgi:cyclohexadieny/prephenate dehydrogenase / 3-phosphoshikimate 1-carboxyvinyltransferase
MSSRNNLPSPVVGRLVVVGLGLIGGSFAKGCVKAGCAWKWSVLISMPQSCVLAVELGVVDRCEADLAVPAGR